MTSRKRSHRGDAFTLIELLVAIAVVGILLAVFLPAMGTRDKPSFPRCLSNARQLNVGFLLYASDHNELFPWQIAKTQTQVTANPEAGASDHFARVANYLRNPQLFVCPTESRRRPAATNFANFGNPNLSYFVSIDAALESQSSIQTNVVKTILLGDRHLSFYTTPAASGLLVVTNHTGMNWSLELHPKSQAGVIGFLDGHAQTVRTVKLPAVFAAQPQPATRLMIP